MPRIVRQTPYPHYKDYKKYKPHLRKDFLYGCVYCFIHENEWGGLRHFHVEHFRPKSLFPELITEYDNLLYACDVCNIYKGNDWPGDNLHGNCYLNPCEHDYDDHFQVSVITWKIGGLTLPARYMIERLHLNRRHLLMLRQKRAREEEIHQRIQHICNERLEMISKSLSNHNLPSDVVEAFEALREQIISRCEERQRWWDERWKPLYEPEDLR